MPEAMELIDPSCIGVALEVDALQILQVQEAQQSELGVLHSTYSQARLVSLFLSKPVHNGLEPDFSNEY